MKTRLLIFMICCSLVASAQQESGMAVFTQAPYRLEYPEKWEADSSGIMGTKVIIRSPAENKDDQFRENVNVLIQDLAGMDIGLEEYKKISESQINDLKDNAELLQSEIIRTGSVSYYRMSYNMVQSTFRLRINTDCYIRDDKAYVITFSSEQSVYASYSDIGEKILKSFTFIN